MKQLLLITFLLLLVRPTELLADGNPHQSGVQSPTHTTSPDMRSRLKLPARLPSQDMRSRLKLPARLPTHPGSPGKPVHPIYPGDKPGRPGHGRPGYWWPAGRTVVQEIQPVIIVNNPPPAEPAPAPELEKMWVPPVMDTRTEPGYWDYGIRKVWMGDHWRFEQDFTDKTWVTESQVEYVKQEGYWKIVE